MKILLCQGHLLQAQADPITKKLYLKFFLSASNKCGNAVNVSTYTLAR